jgi:hypothetical protein
MVEIVREVNKLNDVYAALAFILKILAHIAAMYVEPFENWV